MYILSPYLFNKGDEVLCPSCRKSVFVKKDVLISDERKLVQCCRCRAYVKYGKLQKVGK
jgi:hypothetical protein